jgi:tRNA threonylcarbamoyladenosine biosynthesis protein TsaE
VDARRVFHFDLFRLTDVEELEFVGVRDYFDGDATCLVEWPERGEGLLPPADLVIHLRFDGSARRVILESRSPRGDRFVKLAE